MSTATASSPQGTSSLAAELKLRLPTSVMSSNVPHTQPCYPYSLNCLGIGAFCCVPVQDRHGFTTPGIRERSVHRDFHPNLGVKAQRSRIAARTTSTTTTTTTTASQSARTLSQRTHKSIMELNAHTVRAFLPLYVHMFMSDHVPFLESGLIGKFLSPSSLSQSSSSSRSALHLILSPDRENEVRRVEPCTSTTTTNKKTEYVPDFHRLSGQSSESTAGEKTQP
ncbi:unnamed protein product [Pleuronectes platessa]|uniref:Uncharacterized protein n=1 Tax=Pleuronectes platessa TaxID=8262 RepID=A0A9N7VP84_PLEPL|nr:unnamed protein product [Pleuronectes platessa]